MNGINEIIRQRRSIFPREYNGKTLDENIIETLLYNANCAPNHKSNYPWRFVIIKGEALINWIDECANIYRDETPAEKFKQDKLDKTLGYKHQVSHAIAIVLHREEADKTIEREDICAVACSVQNMYLSLDQFSHAAGYWSTGLGTYSKRMHEYLGLEVNESLMGYFVLGTVENKRTEAHKRDFHKFVRYL